MSELLLTWLVTPIDYQVDRKLPIVDLVYLKYFPIITQLSNEFKNRITDCMKIIETCGEFYCDDYLSHEQASDQNYVPIRLSNSLRLAYLFNNTKNDELHNIMRLIWNSRLLLAFSMRIGDSPYIAALFKDCINFLTKDLLLPHVVTPDTEDGTVKILILNENSVKFGKFIEALRDFCAIEWKQKISGPPEKIEIDRFYSIYRAYMDESVEKRYQVYSKLKNIGFSHNSNSLLNFIHQAAHLDIAKTILVERQLYELERCDIYKFMEKLCTDDNKYARECFRIILEYKSPIGGDDDSVNTNLKLIENYLCRFFLDLTMVVLSNISTQNEDNNNNNNSNDDNNRTNQWMEYPITMYHNLCAMFAIIFPDFHSSVKFQTVLLGCLLDHIIVETSRSIYTTKCALRRLVGKIDKYKYDPTKIDQKLTIYRKLLIDLPSSTKNENTTTIIIPIKDDSYKLSYPFKFTELKRRVSLTSQKSYSKLEKGVDDLKELHKIRSMDLGDFCIYICNTVEFKVSKSILYDKYSSVLLESLVVYDNDEYTNVMDRFHIVITLMVQFTRRIKTTKHLFDTDKMKKKIIHHFNDILRLFLTEIKDATTVKSNNICPHCSNSYTTCLSPLITLDEFITFTDENLEALKSLALVLPAHDEHTKISEEKENEKEEGEKDENENDDTLSLPSLILLTENESENENTQDKFEFTIKEGETYSFL